MKPRTTRGKGRKKEGGSRIGEKRWITRFYQIGRKYSRLSMWARTHTHAQCIRLHNLVLVLETPYLSTRRNLSIFYFSLFFSSIVRYYLSRHFFTPLLLDASSTLNKLNFPVETDSGGGQRRITNVLEAGRQSVINDVSPLQATMRKEMERFFSSNRGWGAAVPRKFPFPPFSLLLLIEEKSQENANNKLISFKIE